MAPAGVRDGLDTHAGADPVDLRVVLLAAVAWVSTWLATSADHRLWLLGAIAAALLAGLAAVRRSWLVAALALLAAACLALGVGRVGALGAGPVPELAVQGASARVEVTMTGASRLWPERGTRPAGWTGGGRLVGIEARGGAWQGGGAVLLRATGDHATAWAAVPLGATVSAEATLSSPEPGEPAVAVVRAREPPRTVAAPDAVSAMVGRLRSGLREACSPLAPEARALVPALVVGDTGGMTDDLTDRFRTTGLTHLTAVSGSNLTLLLAFLRAAAVGVGVRGRALTAVLVAGVLGFVVLCLGEPSVVRAAAMGLVGVVALGWAGRGRQGLHHLAVAVLAVMLVDPWLSRSVGFCLSVLASLGLLCWAASWTDALATWLPRWAAEAVAVPLAAQVATEPVVVVLAGQVSVVGVVANAVAGPLVGPATVLGLVAAGLSAVWLPAAVAAAWLAGWCALGITWVASLGAALPGAAVPFPVSAVTLGLLVVGCALAAASAKAVLTRRWLTLGLAVALLVALLRAPVVPGWPPPVWAVAFCEVGQGDATVVRAGPAAAVVVDTGPVPGALDRCLRALGVAEVPLVALTHLHADHIGGLAALGSRRVARVLRSAVTTPVAGDRQARSVLPGAGQEVARAGSTWQVGAAQLEVIAAPTASPPDGGAPAGEGESSAENDASLLLRATSGGVSLLLAGDAETDGQRERARLAGLDVDVLLVPHHGSARQDPDFLTAASPAVAVVSVGKDNDYGHPAQRTMRLVAGLGARIVRTDLNGAIAVHAGPGALLVTSER